MAWIQSLPRQLNQPTASPPTKMPERPEPLLHKAQTIGTRRNRGQRPSRSSRLQAKEVNRRLSATGLTIPKRLLEATAFGIAVQGSTKQNDAEAILRSLGWTRRRDRSWVKPS